MDRIETRLATIPGFNTLCEDRNYPSTGSGHRSAGELSQLETIR
jgi:hypothetical protein